MSKWGYDDASNTAQIHGSFQGRAGAISATLLLLPAPPPIPRIDTGMNEQLPPSSPFPLRQTKFSEPKTGTLGLTGTGELV